MNNLSKAPKTAEERKLLHNKLVEYARVAVQLKRTKGLGLFVAKINDPEVESQINKWLTSFTTIHISRSAEGTPFYEARASASKDFDLTAAILEPYYSLSPNNTEYAQKKISNKSLHNDKQNLSDREFQKKVIRSALEEALKDPSDISKKRVIELLQSFDKATRKGSPTVSGGLPGLGKKR